MNANATNHVDPTKRFRFSLRHLLSLTAILAAWLAAGLAYQKYSDLAQRRSNLLALSSHLNVLDSDKLQSSGYPRVADDFDTWEVHIPNNESYELRFGIGEVSHAGMPTQFDRIPLQPGQHRVTLHTADSPDENFRYTLFVDGKSVIHREMGEQWIPDGWG